MNNNLVSYLTLRRIVGILGIVLPVIVSVWGFFLLHHFIILSSISQYYTLETRDAFVGILFTIGWFLFAYRGYDRYDNVAGNIACGCALGVGLFPVTTHYWPHTIFAVSLFLILSWFCLFSFTKTDTPTTQKLVRNVVYKICGLIILAAISGIIIIELFFENSNIIKFAPVFIFEVIALWSFGFSWFVKGNTLWKDK